MEKIQVVDYRASDASVQFVESLRNTGFGVLANHPLQQTLVEDIYQEWQAFFNGNSKHSFAFDPDTQDGFFSSAISEKAKGNTTKDIKEYYHIYPWGRVPKSLKGNVDRYYREATGLASRLLGWIEGHSPASVANGYSEPLPSMIADTPNTLLRVLHYPPLTGGEEVGAIRAAAHEDINLITILPAANKPGLQVKGRDGQWMDVPADFGNLIINVGDMLQEASGGYFPSTSHRVINPQGSDNNTSRISLPLFLHPRDDVILSDRYTARGYLHERLKELGVIA